MSKHLIKAVEILKNRYKGEIYESCWFDSDDEDSELYPQGDWSYNLTNWTIQISSDDSKSYHVVAYRVKDNCTDWSDYIVLPSYPLEFELVGESAYE